MELFKDMEVEEGPRGRRAEPAFLFSKFLTCQSYTLLHPYGLREIHLVGVLKRKIGRDEVLMEAEIQGILVELCRIQWMY